MFGRLHIAIAIVAVVCFGSSATAQQWAAKMLQEKEHDFGTVARGADVVYKFPVKNIYRQDIELASVRSSCGCTTPSLDKKVLKTHELGHVVAKFNTRTFTGIHGATLTLTLKWRDERGITHVGEAQLRVHGDIRSDVVFQPGAVRFAAVDQGSAAEQRIRVSYAGRGDWRINDVLSKSNDLEVELIERERSASSVKYDLLVRLRNSAPAGVFREQLVLVTNDSRDHRIPVIVDVNVVPEISVAPVSIVLGDVPEGQSITRKLVVRGKKPFRIVDFHCEDDCFTFSADDRESQRHIVELTFEPDQAEGKIKQVVEISTSLGDNYRAHCTIYANVVLPSGDGTTSTTSTASTGASRAPL